MEIFVTQPNLVLYGSILYRQHGRRLGGRIWKMDPPHDLFLYILCTLYIIPII